MKALPYLLSSLLLAGMLISCETETAWHGTRRLVNETQHTLQLEVRVDSQRHQYQIPSQQEILLSGVCTVLNAISVCDMGWFPPADTATLTFDEERALGFGPTSRSQCEDRNILADPIYGCYGYESMEITRDSIVYTYRITDQDYQNAQPIVE